MPNLPQYPRVTEIFSAPNVFARLAASTGAALVGFKQDGIAAVVRTALAKMREQLSVDDFAPIGHVWGVDDSTVIQRALTEALRSLRSLRFPARTYKLVAPVTGTLSAAGLKLYGDGPNSSVLSWDSTTMTGLSLTGAGPVTIRDLKFLAPASCTAGGCLAIQGTAGAVANLNFGSRIDNCEFYYGHTQIAWDYAYFWNVSDSRIFLAESVGIKVENKYSGDIGDNVIAGNRITCGGTAVNILHISGGGIYIANNKILGGTHGYKSAFTLPLGWPPLDIVFTGNSIEGQSGPCIGFTSALSGGSPIAYNVVISGNQLASTGTKQIDMSDPGMIIDRCSITGNVIGGPGIDMHTVTNFVISGNQFIAAGGVKAYGINVGATCVGTIGTNRFDGEAGGSFTRNIINASGSVTMPPPVTVGGSGASVSCPADTTEDILATYTIPANQLGRVGRIITQATFVTTNSGNNKTLRIRLGGISGTVIWTKVITANGVTSVTLRTLAAAADNAQVSLDATQIDATTPAPASTASGVDMTATQTIVVTGQKAVAGETLTLFESNCVMYPG